MVPILKNVEETIVGIIKRNEKGFKIPPVNYSKELNCIKSNIRNKDA